MRASGAASHQVNALLQYSSCQQATLWTLGVSSIHRSLCLLSYSTMKSEQQWVSLASSLPGHENVRVFRIIMKVKIRLDSLDGFMVVQMMGSCRVGVNESLLFL